jgi:hypothetical protein
MAEVHRLGITTAECLSNPLTRFLGADRNGYPAD